MLGRSGSGISGSTLSRRGPVRAPAPSHYEPCGKQGFRAAQAPLPYAPLAVGVRAAATGRNRIGGKLASAGAPAGGGEQFVPLPYTMLHSPAWRDLSGAAVKLFLELRSRFNGGNNGDLSLSHDEAARLLGLSKATVHRAYAELADHGFIRKVKPGRWYGRLATTWRVTDRPWQGHLATRDWQHWRPPRKTEIGTVAAPSPVATVPPGYRL